MKGNRHKIPFSYLEINGLPSDLIGVYAFLLKNDGRCIYVGQAKEQPIKKRLNSHWSRSHNPMLRSWIKAFGKHMEICYTIRDKSQIDRLERRLIKSWNPKTNIQHNKE